MAFPRRRSGKGQHGQAARPCAPRDVTMSSTCCCLPPSQGFHVPAACTTPQICCQPRQQCGEWVCDIEPGNVSPCLCGATGHRVGNMEVAAAVSPQTPFHQHCSLLPWQGFQALPWTNSSVLSSLSSTSDALLIPKDYSSCSSTTIKALQLRTGPTEAALPQGGKEVLPMKALSSLAASGTVIRLICAGSTVGAVFLPQAPPIEKGELPLPLWCRIKEEY